MYCSDETGSIVADIGSSMCKFGFGGEDVPRCVFPSVYGCVPQENNNLYVGQEAVDYRRDKMQICPTVSNGELKNHQAYSKIMETAINYSLSSKQEDHPFLLIESPFSINKQREELLQLIMEEQRFPACYFAKAPTCITFAMGRTTALTVDMGASEIRVSPVCDGYTLKESSKLCSMGGDYIDTCLYEYLTSKQINIIPHYMVSTKLDKMTGDRQRIITDYPAVHPSYKKYQIMNIVRDIKETYLQVFPKYTTLLSTATKEYELPDGTCINLTDEGVYIPEVLMKNNTTDSNNNNSLIDAIYSSLEASNVDIRKELCSNILVGGGLSRLANINERIYNELYNKINNTFKLKVSSPEKYHKQYIAWLGGSILSSLGSFQNLWISKQEYDEVGTQIISQRC